MNDSSVGTIHQLTRYPVKSMAGQPIDQTYIAKYGLYGDRSHAFIDPTKEGWNRYITARKFPQMLGYQAKLHEASTGNELHTTNEFPPVHITSPDGRELRWDETLLQEMQMYSDRTLTMIHHQPDSQELLAVDSGGILIISDRSLRKLENLVGSDVDPRRFRANMLLTLYDTAEDETNWIGKKLRIGECRLEVIEPCERCMLITIDPDTYERNVNILKKVNQEMNLQFGVYANVIEVGDVRIGDEVYLENEVNLVIS
ncbi:MOSC domain-containing protein [Paenibacillus sp. KN14-4R]|uniref:MOSC domain-containing protein n=1 Tax=Paenibacillus sp. KN14-4R TaxID=3445773 RepID=UPI003FA1624D